MVGPNVGYHTLEGNDPTIYLCSFCDAPTYFRGEEQVPGVAYGNEVDNVPNGVSELYGEARRCFSVSAYTSAVLACRKLLMNIAVAQGADEGKTFMEYVD